MHVLERPLSHLAQWMHLLIRMQAKFWWTDKLYVQWADFPQAAAQLPGRAPHALEGGVCSEAGTPSASLRQEA